MLLGWLLAAICLALPIPDAEAQGRRDARVIQQGTVTAAFAGDDAGQGGTGLRLTSLGRWRDDRDVERYTIWRLRNSSTVARTVRLDAPGTGFSVTFGLSARTEAFVRSPIILGAATHRLFEGAVQVDVKAAGTQAWSDSSLVAPLTGTNRPPVFLSTPPPLADVGQAYRYPVMVFDADNDPVVLSAPTAPAGYQFDPATGVFRFVPQPQHVGEQPIQSKADDGRGGVARQDFTLRVLDDFCPLYPIAVPDARVATLVPPAAVANLPRGTGSGNFSWLTWSGSPSAPTLAASLAVPGDSWRYVDPDDPADRVPDVGDWIQGAPGNMNSSAVNAALELLRNREIIVPTWTITRGNGNNLDYRVARFARVRLSAWTLTGQGTLSFEFLGWADCHNDPPLAADLSVETTAGQPVDVVLAGTDPDGDPLTFAVAAKPGHGTLSGTPPVVTFTPAASFTGADRFTYTASDGLRVSEPGVVRISVRPSTSNRPPVATPARQVTDEDTGVAVVLEATDPDGDALTFQVVREPAHGVLSGTPPRLNYQPAANFAGEDSFDFRVSDGTLQSAPAQVVIEVRAVNDPPIARPLDIVTDEDTPVQLQLRGDDIDSPTLSFAVVSPPAHGVLSGDPPGLTYRPAPDFNGEDQFTYVARDGSAESPPAVARVSVRPINDPPRITSTPPGAVAIGAEFRYDVDAIDPDGDLIRYTLPTAPAGMTIDSATGLIRWTPVASATYPVEVIVAAVDPGDLFEQQRFLLAATPVNRPPVFQTTAPGQAQVGSAYAYDADATDPDGDVVSYALADAPSGMVVGASSGVISWTPLPTQIGIRTATLYARDGRGGEATQQITIDVRAANRPPVITSTAPTTATVGVAYAYPVIASDPDGDALTYALAASPTGMVIGAATGVVAWTPTSAQVGSRTFRVVVADGRGGEVEQAVTVVVSASNRPPVITSTALTSASVGRLYRLLLTATDPDNDPLQWSLVAQPAGMMLADGPPRVEWTPQRSQLGTQPVAVRVSDGRGGTADLAFEVTVRENSPPEIVSMPSYFAVAGAAYRYDVEAIDPDAGDILTFTLPIAPASASVDPGSGLVDWQVPTQDADGITAHNTLCRLPSRVPGTLNATVKWHWNEESVLSAPLVVPLTDTNGNGRIDEGDRRYVVVSTFTAFVDNADATIRAFDATTGAVVWTQAAGSQLIRASTSLAAADVDRDGSVEIFGIAGRGANEGEVVAFDAAGRQLWVSNGVPENPVTSDYSSPSIADIDADGVPEILHRATVINANGSIRWSRPELEPWFRATTYAVDLDGDGEMEVVAGPDVLSAAGTLLFSLTSNSGSMTAVGNFDSDDQPEIVLAENGGGGNDAPFISLFEHDGSRIWGPISLNGGGGGPPTVADFDGDGLPEIGVSGEFLYSVVDTDGRILWQREIVDFSSKTTGSTVFDFDGDGAMEVAFADEVAFTIFDGSRGAPRLVWPNSTFTAAEFPVVADVDGDGAAEIVIVADRSPDTGLKVLEASQGQWIGTRSIWNQYNYTIDNINDDMTIPVTPPRGWTTHNSFRLNALLDRDPLGLPDLAVYGLHSKVDSDVAAMTVANRGIAASPPTTLVVRHGAGAPGSMAVLANLALPALAPGETRLIEVSIPPGVAAGDRLIATIDEPGLAQECEEGNNVALGTPLVVRVQDEGQGEDHQAFRVSARRANRPPVLAQTTLAEGLTLHRYEGQVSASDPDLGDAVFFSLITAPAGLRIESPSGRILWIPSATQGGTHEVHVRATDLSGLSDERRYSITVNQNRSPVITTTVPEPIEVARQTYFEIDIDAFDPDGDPVTFRAADPLVLGVTVNAVSGLVRWYVPDGYAGLLTIAVEATDDFLGSARLQFQVRVIAGGANIPPVFTSVPITSAVVDTIYYYSSEAMDPDRDPLVASAITIPEGMQAIPVSSALVLTWRPTLAQRGPHPVVLEVSDGRGGVATQSFTINVLEAGNYPPSITSTPAMTAKVGRTYGYAATAADLNLDPLTFSLTSAPAGVSVDPSTGFLQWTPTSGQVGAQSLTLRVSDGFSFAEQSWNVEVLDASVPLGASVTVAPSFVAPGGSISVMVDVTGAAGQVTYSAVLTPPGMSIVLDPDGETTLTVPTTPGCRTLDVVISDGVDTITRAATFCVQDPSDTTPPDVTLHAPGDNAEVTAPVAIRATVTDTNLRSWLLVVRPANSPNATPTVLAQGTSAVVDQQIGTFDPTLLINGQYALILQATDVSGNVSSDSVVVRVTGDMKVGHFAITFEDVSIPLAGIPVRVTRTYDTRQRSEPLDFGHGWSIDYQNVRIRESAKAGLSWRNFQPIPGPFGQWCTRSGGDRVVTVTLPDGAVESFRAKAEPECTALVPEINVQLVYEPIDGTDSRLEQTDYGLVRLVTIAGSDVYNIVDPDSPNEPVDPRNYRLTTPEGLVYELDQFFGVRRVIEPGGQSLTYSASGILHSTGVGVQFVRDANGRIDDIVLPDGRILSYTYTPSGDLESFADALAQTTTFRYELPAFPHYLSEIVDPRGVRAIRNEYDGDGRLVATIDADGHRIEYTHDIDGRREQVRDRRGFLMTYVYDDEGRVLAETNALGETVLRTYDGDGNVLSETDPLGQTTSYTYDARGNRLSETNALGETVTSTYDARNNLLAQVDALGRASIRNQFHPNSNFLVEMQDALGAATRFGYDLGIGSGQTGELIGMTDAAGAVTRYELDPANRGWRTAEVDALGNRVTYTHDSMGRVVSETRTRTVDGVAQALVTRYTLDAKGRVTRTELPDGSATTTEYGLLDKPVRECDALDRCTLTLHDNRGNVSRIEHPDGTSESTTHDANGNVVGQTDRAGRTTTMTYDAANRLLETIHPDDTPLDGTDNPRNRNEYDSAGRLVATTDEDGRRTAYVYDAAGRRTVLFAPPVDGVNATTVTSYDAAGQRSAVTDALGRTTRFAYDAAGRLTTTIHPDAGPDDGNDDNNPRTQVAYDALGRKTAEVDPDGRRTEYAYDALGRLASVVLAAGTPSTTTTTYAYDEQGNRTTQTDAEGRATRFTFDRMGREASRTLPLGQRETKTWTAAGEPDAVTDFNGRTTRWTHDAAGRVVSIDYPNDPDVALGYTATGQRATAVDGHGTTTQVFDARDRLVRRTDSAGRVIEYTYDAAGHLTSRVTASQSLVYTYDGRGRLSTVTATVAGGTPRTTTYTYDAVGNRAGMSSADGTQTSYSYDRRNRLVGLVQRSAAAALLFSASYTVDATGLRSGAQESDASGVVRTLTWSYDALKRLTAETIDHRDDTRDRTSTSTYDRVGNRLTQTITQGTGGAARSTLTTSTYDANDRLTQESAQENGGPAQLTTFAYDAQGNTLTKSAPGGVADYAWDDANRLIEQREAGSRTTYRYNVDGLRIGQTTFPATGSPRRIDYLVDPTFAYANVIERFEGSADAGAPAPKLAAGFTFGEGIVGQTTCAPTATSGAHDCPGAQERFIHADGFGSTRLLTDSAGTITDRIDYDAFGNEIHREGATDVEHLYRGEQFDPNLGFYYLRARYMDPGRGRFARMDDWRGNPEEPRSLQKYAYASSDPINRIDPGGMTDSLVSQGVAIATAGIIASTAAVATNALVRFGVRSANQVIASRAAAVECAGRYRGTAMTGPASCGGNSAIPILFMIATQMPAISLHIEASQSVYGRPALLSRSWILKDVNRRWAKTKCAMGVHLVLNAGASCDEYPFASTHQGGPQSTVAGVPLTENWLQGGIMSWFYAACGVAPDVPYFNEFLVIPVLAAPRAFQCGG